MCARVYWVKRSRIHFCLKRISAVFLASCVKWHFITKMDSLFSQKALAVSFQRFLLHSGGNANLWLQPQIIQSSREDESASSISTTGCVSLSLSLPPSLSLSLTQTYKQSLSPSPSLSLALSFLSGLLLEETSMTGISHLQPRPLNGDELQLR